MNTIKSLGLAGLATAALFAGQVFATPCPIAPIGGAQTQGSPVCIAPTSPDSATNGAPADLQSQLNNITTSGPLIDVYNGQTHPSSWWAPGATGLSANKFLFEIAGNANINSFGIFDPTNSANHLQLFSGPATAGWSTTLFVDLAGTTYSSVQFDGSANPQGPTTHATFGAANLFGYYLDTPNGFFYSVPGMNDASSAYPDGMPHMVAYQGGNGTYINGRQFLANEFLLAWEDQPFDKSDLDYNDFVVMVESVHPVPEPAALGMFGLGALLIGAFVGMRRREQV